jgi:phenylacetic acid degradation protein
MNVVVMDEAEIGEQAVVGACSFVPAGMKVPPRTLATGSPAKVRCELSQLEIDWKRAGTQTYQVLTRRCLESLVETFPLTAVEVDRPRVRAPQVEPLIATKREQTPLQSS